jgi:hypothetical protein
LANHLLIIPVDEANPGGDVCTHLRLPFLPDGCGLLLAIWIVYPATIDPANSVCLRDETKLLKQPWLGWFNGRPLIADEPGYPPRYVSALPLAQIRGRIAGLMAADRGHRGGCFAPLDKTQGRARSRRSGISQSVGCKVAPIRERSRKVQPTVRPRAAFHGMPQSGPAARSGTVHNAALSS